jgi:hypothetical protein
VGDAQPVDGGLPLVIGDPQLLPLDHAGNVRTATGSTERPRAEVGLPAKFSGRRGSASSR